MYSNQKVEFMNESKIDKILVEVKKLEKKGVFNNGVIL